MFGSTVLDLAMGLILSFLLISLITSTTTEAWASVRGWRANTLLQGVKDLLNDKDFTGLALKLYNHGLVNPQSDGNATTEADLKAKPSYIDSQHFATALIEELKTMAAGAASPPQPAAGDAAAPPQPAAAAAAPLPLSIVNSISDPQLKRVLSGIITRAKGNIDQVHSEIAAWFDQGMARVAGVYKRYAQLWNFLIALALAIAFNLDAVKIAQALWQQPTLVKGISAPAAGADALKVFQQVQDLGLPFGWDQPAIKYLSSPLAWASEIAGWLIMAGSTLFGAAFWFDALQRITQLRGAGPKNKR